MKLQIQVDGKWLTYSDEDLDPCFDNDPYNYWFQMGNNLSARAECGELKVPQGQEDLPQAFWDGVEHAAMVYEEFGQVS